MLTLKSTPKYEVIKTSNYTLHIPTDVHNKIKQLCTDISEVEWSGVLFYTHTGSFEDNDLVLTCKDILLMDIGSHAYTEYDFNEDVATYYAENIEALSWSVGLIHSHNSMAVFFSGTDMSTMHEYGSKFNHFLSLIVNNAGDRTAMVSLKSTHTPTMAIASYNTFKNAEVSKEVAYKGDPSSSLTYYELTITEDKTEVLEECSSLKERTAFIREKKEKERLAIVNRIPTSHGLAVKQERRKIDLDWSKALKPKQGKLFPDWEVDEYGWEDIKEDYTAFEHEEYIELLTDEVFDEIFHCSQIEEFIAVNGSIEYYQAIGLWVRQITIKSPNVRRAVTQHLAEGIGRFFSNGLDVEHKKEVIEEILKNINTRIPPLQKVGAIGIVIDCLTEIAMNYG